MQCTRILEFDAGHRLINHESKCKYLHGHRYKIEISFYADHLDQIGRVVDFSCIKKILGTWIDSNLDHTTILHIDDKNLGNAIEIETKQKIYYMDCNPTAENIVKHLFEDIIPSLFIKTDIKCSSIKLHETPNCSVKISK